MAKKVFSFGLIVLFLVLFGLGCTATAKSGDPSAEGSEETTFEKPAPGNSTQIPPCTPKETLYDVIEKTVKACLKEQSKAECLLVRTFKIVFTAQNFSNLAVFVICVCTLFFFVKYAIFSQNIKGFLTCLGAAIISTTWFFNHYSLQYTDKTDWEKCVFMTLLDTFVKILISPCFYLHPHVYGGILAVITIAAAAVPIVKYRQPIKTFLNLP